jgi:hypothetical protein
VRGCAVSTTARVNGEATTGVWIVADYVRSPSARRRTVGWRIRFGGRSRGVRGLPDLAHIQVVELGRRIAELRQPGREFSDLRTARVLHGGFVRRELDDVQVVARPVPVGGDGGSGRRRRSSVVQLVADVPPQVWVPKTCVTWADVLQMATGSIWRSMSVGPVLAWQEVG